MNRNIILGLLAVLLLGGGAFFILSGDDDSDTSNNTDTTASADTAQMSNASTNQAENPFLPTVGMAFTADLVLVDASGTTNATIKYDGDNAWGYSAETAEGMVEFRNINGTLYTYNPEAESWISFGTDAGLSTFDTTAYEYNSNELDAFKSQATFLGQQPCPAGMCDTWRTDNYDELSDFTMAFDSQGRISRVSGNTPDGSTTISYNWGAVSVPVPENAEMFGLPGNP